MKIDISKTIEAHYSHRVKSVSNAPRQFVADTYFIKTSSGEKLFCKIVDKHIFIPRIIKSLPVLDALHKAGFDKIGYPLRTKSDNLWVMVDDILIVLFNHIDAPQNYDYDNFSFGKLLGEVHKLTPKIDTLIEKEGFSFQYKELFEKQFEDSLNTEDTNTLKILLKTHESEIRSHYSYFNKIISICSEMQFDFVITHGDAPGNTLVKSPTDLYLIDWDEISLAPPERDLWFLDDVASFLDGYRSEYPNYQINEYSRAFFVLNRHFNDLVEYFAEILGNQSAEHKKLHIEKLSTHLTGWIAPHIDKVVSSNLV